MDKGSVHIFCGQGKGKTTAAIGQGIRLASRGKTVFIIQFLKEKQADEIGFIKRLEPEIKVFRFEKFEKSYSELSEEEKKEEAQNLRNGLNFARKVLATGECDVLILDEALGLLQHNIVELEEFKLLLESRDSDSDVIFTGEYPGKELWEYVHEVTELTTIYQDYEKM